MFVDSSLNIVEGINVQKLIEPKILGMYKDEQVYLMYGKYGYYVT